MGGFQRENACFGVKWGISVEKMCGTVNDNGELVFDGTKADIYVGFGQPDDRTKELTNKNVHCMNI